MYSLFSFPSRRPARYAGTAAKFILALCCSVVIASGLNDTGQVQCYDASNNPTTCSAKNDGNSANPQQDARYGRDARTTAGLLTKTGGGVAGFDYTKVSNSGTPLTSAASLGANATDWACTKDNVTGLTWEVKTTSGLRSLNHSYTWYSNSTANGAHAGTLGANTCSSSLASFNNQCNTQNYVTAVNSASLCGTSDWRLPTRKELLTLVYAGATAAPQIDTAYFPNTSNTSTWTWWTHSTNALNATFAWYVDFSDGNSYASGKTVNGGYPVRLVRGGP